MAKKLDAEKIEKARRDHSRSRGDNREELRREIIDTINENRAGKRKVTVIEPEISVSTSGRAPQKRVAAYCRVSTIEDAQLNSMEMQRQHFKRVISENPDYRLVRIYADEGISGTSVRKREGFNSLMEDCRSGKIDMILTKSISRFGRNIIDVLSALEELSDLSPPVSVYFENEGVGTSDGRNSLIITILSAVAEMESQQKSLAIKAGIRYKMQEGIYKFGLSNTLGYYRDYAGRIRIEPAEAEIVRYIYDSFVEGATFSSIADSLTEMEILSPSGKPRWRGSTIKSILMNEKYCGNVLYQKTYVKNFKTHMSVKNVNTLRKWLWEDVHAAIIPHEKWDLVQNLIRDYNPSKRKIGARVVNIIPHYFRVKSGVLRGYYLIDLSWNRALREAFIELVKNSEATKGE